MHEILHNLRSGALVLDLGSGMGSVGAECYPEISIILLDSEFPPESCGGRFVQAHGAHLPFPDNTFDAVIANHSLEHMDKLATVLQEIGRVVRRDGSLYVAVPDRSTFTDRLYRWIYHGGGHINCFQSAEDLTRHIARATALRRVAMRVLHSSLRFLERGHFRPRSPRKLWLLGNGHPAFIAAFTYALRIIDRSFGTRTSVYGWALYFGNIPEEIETAPWTNVCVRCGAGHAEASLIVNKRVRRHRLMFRIQSYICPNCGAWNLFTKDRA